MPSATLRDLVRQPSRTARYLLWRAAHPRPWLARPIFLVGCPRSGTSLAVEMFATHPDVANWSEAGRLWDPYDYRNPEADHCWGAERVTPGAARRLHGWCEWHRQAEHKQRFVNKHPRNSVRIDYLRAIFPDAVFIHVVRDGRATASSMLKQIRTRPRRQQTPFGGFCKPPHWRELAREDWVEQTAVQWGEIVRYIRDRGVELGSDYFEVQYEPFCADPRGALRAMFEFAGLPVTDALLAGLPEKLDARNHKFKSDLSPDEIRTIERVEGALLVELGYELTSANIPR